MSSETPAANLVNDNLLFQGEPYEVVSPVDNQVIQSVYSLDQGGVKSAIDALAQAPESFDQNQVFTFISNLKQQCIEHKEELLRVNHLETGFIDQDNQEMIDGIIEFLEDFPVYVEQSRCPEAPLIKHSYSGECERYMRIVKRPYKCVAALVPQNASLSLAVITIVSAMYVGSKVIVRPSLQCGASGALLARLIKQSEAPVGSVSIVNCKARDFLEACYQSELVDMVHYIGSDRYARGVLNDCFAHGKNTLIDGEGNGMLYVDQDYPLEQAVRLVVDGISRYNGETCTSINGVLVHSSRYAEFKSALTKAISELRLGHPSSDGVQIGPLFSSAQADYIVELINEHAHVDVLCGGQNDGAYLAPTLIAGVTKEDRMVREGFFGPVAWIASVEEGEVGAWLDRNRFPLSDTILSNNKDRIKQFIRRSRAARICINQDPSIESMFEPWGGYPPGGLNIVSTWTDKYLQAIQLDGFPQEIEDLG